MEEAEAEAEPEDEAIPEPEPEEEREPEEEAEAEADPLGGGSAERQESAKDLFGEDDGDIFGGSGDDGEKQESADLFDEVAVTKTPKKEKTSLFGDDDDMSWMGTSSSTKKKDKDSGKHCCFLHVV